MRRLWDILAGVGVLVVLAGSIPATRAATHTYNITKILADHPEFSTFNHYLSATRLAGEINRRRTITVLAIDNSAMAPLLAKHLTLESLRNVLRLHILADYYGAKKLHQLTGGSAVASSMFQATGDAPGTSGYVNITDHRAGKVTFIAQDAGDGAAPASFVKSVKEMPYDLSVIQINDVLTSPEAEAPVPPPAPVNLTDLMSKKGCKAFADLLRADPDVEKTFDATVDGGLTVFCPGDAAVKAFMAKFKNLTTDGKASLLLYHGVPVYYSIQMLKSNNGAVNTLATDGTSKNFNYTVQNDGEVVTLKTKIVTATIKSTIIDQDPVAVFVVDKVLEPRELFKIAADVSAPAPAPVPVAKKHKAAKGTASPPAPAGPEEAPADEKASDNAAGRNGGRWVVAAVATVATVAAVGIY